MVKSATARVVKESSKLDLDEWLRGGKPRTKTAYVSSDPSLADEMTVLAERIDELADQIDAADEVVAGGIADDESLVEVRAEHADAIERYRELEALHAESLMAFTFRAQNQNDAAQVKKILADAEVAETKESASLALVVATCVDPLLSYEQLDQMLNTLGVAVLHPLAEAVAFLSKKQEKPAAPLSLRP